MKQNFSTLLVNRWMTPDGIYLQSKHRYDYVTYSDTDENFYSVDGGTIYCHVTSPEHLPMTNMCLFVGYSHEEIRKHFCWGTRGKKGDEPLTYIKLKDIEDEHLTALVSYPCVPKIKNLLINEQNYRQNTKLKLYSGTLTTK